MTAHGPIARALVGMAAATIATGALAAAQAAPSLADVLTRAGAYLSDYQDRVTMVMLEEDYTQRRTYTFGNSASGTRTIATESKRLRSDVVMTVEPGPRWVTFRDVFEVEGRPVRDRDERLAKLFLAPTDQTGDQAVVLRFSERGTPRILRSDDGAPARGTFWIEPVSGRVLRSELVFTSSGRGIGTVTATIRVTYAREPRTDLWLPVVMDERYAFANLDTSIITGTARYSNARQFAVDTTSSVQAPAR